VVATFLKQMCVFGGSFQVVCGQNCTFLLQSNGTVLAIGEGQYGRLGQGNSDDLYVPTIISAFQGATFIIVLLLSQCFCPQQKGGVTMFILVLPVFFLWHPSI